MKNIKENYATVLLSSIFLLHLFLLASTQFTLWPEILSFPYLLNNGYMLYKDYVHPYPPALTLFLSLIFTVFGYKVLLIQAFVWSTILLSDFMIYKIALHAKVNKGIISIGLISYVFLQVFLDGNMLWYDTALTLPLLLLIYFYQKGLFKYSNVTLLSLLLIKQSSVFVATVYFFSLIYRKNWIALKHFLVSSTIVGLILCCYLIFQGSITDAYHWVFSYPSTFWTHFPGYVQMHVTRHEVLTILLLGVCPFILFTKRKFVFVSLLFFASLFAVYPRFSFFHLQPAVALSVLCFMMLMKNKTIKSLIPILIVLILFVGFIVKPYVSYALSGGVRFFKQEDDVFASKIKKVIPQGESVYFLNIPSHLYVRTQTLPPKPWLDLYGWYFEVPGVQSDVLKQWNTNMPTYIIWKEKSAGNWYDIGAYEPEGLVKWILMNYEKRTEIERGIWLWKKL